MVEFETEVIEIITRTANVKSFRFRLLADISFQPGQYFLLTIKVEGQEKTKPFSFSNSPTEKGYIEFTKRITESEFSMTLAGMKVGDWARVKMPGGVFTFTGEYPKIAFLSGGIGITPVRSICKYVTDMDLNTDIILIYGNNREDDIIFRNDLSQLKIRVVYTLLSGEVDKNKWPGRTGRIDSRMIKEEIPDYAERFFYVCGPPAMVKNLVDILRGDLQLPEERIKLEKFAGY